jgi:hypothetical protein
MDKLPMFPAWLRTKFPDWTNIPPEPQQGSYTRPVKGFNTSTKDRTTQDGV